MSVNALEIWKRLRESVGETAQQYYWKKLGSGINLSEKVLERGGADFDQKYFPDDPDEEVFFKTDLYIWQYMDMHLKQNLVVLRKYLNDLTEGSCSIFFIDFGCGPMTSGLALAEIISNRNVYYYGIDVSQNMVESANWINKNYNIFDPDRFKVIQANTLNDKIKELSSTKNFNLAVLSMSFVMAPGTNKAPNQDAWARGLAQKWDQFSEFFPETRAIYINPDFYGAHVYWDKFCSALQQSQVFSYTGGEQESISIPTLPNPIIAAQMIGKRK